jgi:ArsR family transcriptional regulator, virulence genes transcriptional regulator
MPYGSLLLTAGRASRLLKAMGNTRRLAILCHLSEREHSVNELCTLIGLSQSALSQHLARLRRDNLVKTRRVAQTVYYSLASSEVAPLLQTLSEIAAGPARTPPPPDQRAPGGKPAGTEFPDHAAFWPEPAD